MRYRFVEMEHAKIPCDQPNLLFNVNYWLRTTIGTSIKLLTLLKYWNYKCWKIYVQFLCTP